MSTREYLINAQGGKKNMISVTYISVEQSIHKLFPDRYQEWLFGNMKF